MRKWHRWLGFLSAIFFSYIAITGVALQFELWLSGHAPPGHDKPKPAEPSTLPDTMQINADIGRAMQIAKAQKPNLSTQKIEVSYSDKGGIVTIGGNSFESEKIMIDPKAGKIMPPPPKKIQWHGLFQDLHAGYSFGIVGRIISVLMGISLLVLSITGLMVYIDMFSRRKKNGGKNNLFWS
jgi:uncharacterized iron-regulated membrane protein